MPVRIQVEKEVGCQSGRHRYRRRWDASQDTGREGGGMPVRTQVEKEVGCQSGGHK